MTYDLAQNLLTLFIQIVAITGFAGIYLHFLWTMHKRWLATYCPPVAPFQPEPQSKNKPTCRASSKGQLVQQLA